MYIEKVLTIWKDSTWKVWNELDATYATGDEDWLLNINLSEILKELDGKYLIDLITTFRKNTKK